MLGAESTWQHRRGGGGEETKRLSVNGLTVCPIERMKSGINIQSNKLILKISGYWKWNSLTYVFNIFKNKFFLRIILRQEKTTVVENIQSDAKPNILNCSPHPD